MSYGNKNANDPSAQNQYPQQQRRSGGRLGGLGGAFKTRIVIALAIALFAFVGYMSKTEVNPVTGEKQRVEMDADREMALGLQAAPEMLREMGGGLDPARDPRAQLVQELGLKLVYKSDSAKSPYAQKKNFNFFLINDTKNINAFALPGGQVFITRALFDKLENEAQVAGVLGHEIGHVIHRHGAQQMAKQGLGQSVVGAVAVGAGGDQSMTQIAQMVNQFRQLSYGREDELESDDWGMRTMVQCGYDPAEMIGVMNILKQATGSGPRGNEWGSTHPHPESRIEAIKQFLEKNKEMLKAKSLSKGQIFR